MKKVLLAFLVILFGLLIYFPFLPNEKMTEENVNRPQRVLDQAEQELIKREAQKRKALKTEGRTAPALQSVQEEGPNLPEPICRGGYCFAGMAKEMVFDRTDTNTIVLATETGGAWFSSTRGESWQVIDDDWASIYLLTVMQSQTDPNLFSLVALVYGPGIKVK